MTVNRFSQASLSTPTRYRNLMAGSTIIPTDFELISTTFGTGSSGTVTFSSIPQTYKHLQLRMVYDYGTSAGFSTFMRFNSDSAGNYSSHALTAAGTSVGSGVNVSQTNINPTSWAVGYSGDVNVPYLSVVDILDYTSTAKNKTTRAIEGTSKIGTATEIGLVSGAWYSLAAISSITLYINTSYNFGTRSRFSLYGLKG